MNGDDGSMSLDFLAGFTIFMLALIIVVSLVPGLLVGLQSSGIDYDAVAYRTGVILVEDPGWPLYPAWEQYGAADKDKIERIGLAVSRETPNILLSEKVNALFDAGLFSYPDDYHGRVIFGDYPYSFNISLTRSDGSVPQFVGAERPSGYGYIRRVVMIKEPANLTVNCMNPDYLANPSEATQTFTVQLDYSELLDPTIGSAYQIDPRAEPVIVSITNFGASLNGTSPDPTLRKVRLSKNGVTLNLPDYTVLDPAKYQLSVDGAPVNLTPGLPVTGSIDLRLEPAWLATLPLDQNSILGVTYTFDDSPPRTLLSGTHLYDYDNTTRPVLARGALEVAVW
ncbi:hypothetical protein [Methanoculleus taiwanensis]|nr:hypothetical protein [Methanoculleus taiwanensis]